MRIFALALFSFLLAGAVGAREPATETRARVEEVVFESGGIQLAGRLWLPVEGGPHPAVVFIPGSGRSIRDLQLDPDPVPFHFTREGVAFLAWDKRGVRDSEGVFEPLDDADPRAQLARLRLLASDASAAMSYLASREDIDPHRIGVSAFSQGGWVASLLEAAGGEPRFVIVVGGPAVSVGEEGAYSEFADAARQASRDGERPVEMDQVYRAFEEARLREGDFGGYDPRHGNRVPGRDQLALGCRSRPDYGRPNHGWPSQGRRGYEARWLSRPRTDLPTGRDSAEVEGPSAGAGSAPAPRDGHGTRSRAIPGAWRGGSARRCARRAPP